MGSRSRLNVEENGKRIVSVYRQYDGYPSGMGDDIAEFCRDLTITNGISSTDTGATANGIGCLAAQLIKHLKEGVGGVYIRDTSDDSHGEEFVYTVYENDGRINVRCASGHMTAFGMPGDEEETMEVWFDGPTAEFSGKQIESQER